jgi:hypothetical protein
MERERDKVKERVREKYMDGREHKKKKRSVQKKNNDGDRR